MIFLVMNNQVPSSVDSFSIDSSNASVSKSDIGVISKYTENAAKAHRAKTENINMLQNADKDDYLPSTFESGDNVDKVLSGESLYKVCL